MCLMKMEDIMKITHVMVMMIMIKPLLISSNGTYCHLYTKTLVRTNEKRYWEFKIYYVKSGKINSYINYHFLSIAKINSIISKSSFLGTLFSAKISLIEVITLGDFQKGLKYDFVGIDIRSAFTFFLKEQSRQMYQYRSKL